MEREINDVSAHIYEQIGWDQEPNQGHKHYRRVLERELENDDLLLSSGKASQFDVMDIYTGQSRGKNKGEELQIFQGSTKLDQTG